MKGQSNLNEDDLPPLPTRRRWGHQVKAVIIFILVAGMFGLYLSSKPPFNIEMMVIVGLHILVLAFILLSIIVSFRSNMGKNER